MLGAKSAMSKITIHSATATTVNIDPGPQRSRTGSRTNGIIPLDRRLNPYAVPAEVALAKVGKTST